jgi:hypothetical protein
LQDKYLRKNQLKSYKNIGQKLTPLYHYNKLKSIAKGGYYALDDLCDTCGALAVGTDQRSHDWWIHSYFACHRNRCGVD